MRTRQAVHDIVNSTSRSRIEGKEDEQLVFSSVGPVLTISDSWHNASHHYDRLEENLRSCFTLDYPDYEILFAVHRADDPAVAVVEKVWREFPHGPRLRLVETGFSTIPNAKAHSLECLVERAKHDILAITDSDVCVPPGLLRSIAAEFQASDVGVVSCPYRGVPGSSIWSRLEAIGMNTEFLSSVLLARRMGEMDFALGPTLATRREVIEALGGYGELGQYCAEDFVIGNRMPALGYRVVLSRCIVEHRIGSQPLKLNVSHRLRWARSTRYSRPLAYWGLIFTNPIPVAMLLLVVRPALWPLAALTAGLRALTAWAAAKWVLDDPLTAREWWLVPLQDLLSFGTWIAGFFGNTIEWRGRRFSLFQNGRLQVLGGTPEAASAVGGPQITFPPSDITVREPAEEILLR